MKNLSFIFLLIVFQLSGQTPQGKLFIHLSSSQPSRLAYIDFSTSSLVIIDTVELNDIIQLNNTLYTAGYDIFAYNLITLQKTDTIPNVYANRLETWDNKLVVLSTAAPHFRIYNISNNNLLFSLNTNKVPVIPNDVVVLSNKAYLVYDTTLQIVDLLLQDTLATLQTPHPFIFGGMNFFVFSALNDVYIDVEYATGAPRFSLLKLDQQNMLVDTVFHQEMDHNSTKPVVANNIIYLAHFLSFYNVTIDSLVMAGYNASYVVDHDPQTNLLFVYNSQNSTLSSYFNNIFPQTITLSGWLNKALFVPSIPAGLDYNEEKYSVAQVYPNPIIDILNIRINEDINFCDVSLIDLSGNYLFKSASYTGRETIKIDIGRLNDGIYLLVICTDKKIQVKKLVKIQI